MNPLILLNHVSALLHAEAKKGPGTVFLMFIEKEFTVTRCPPPEQSEMIVAKYDAQEFCKGLAGRQFFTLMNKAEKALKGKAQS